MPGTSCEMFCFPQRRKRFFSRCGQNHSHQHGVYVLGIQQNFYSSKLGTMFVGLGGCLLFVVCLFNCPKLDKPDTITVDRDGRF